VPRILGHFPFHYRHFKDHHTQIAWGVSHRSFGQHGNEALYAVAFRGTSMRNLNTFTANWLTNLKLLGSELDGMIVHSGFLDALLPHKEEILLEVLKEAKGHHRILVTGHSLGAALAHLFAYFLKKAMPHIKVELITAGSPRVGDYRFVTKLENMTSFTYRVNDWCDMIPTTPKSVYKDLKLIGMMHVGPQITVGSDAPCWPDPSKILKLHKIGRYIHTIRDGIVGAADPICNFTKKHHKRLIKELLNSTHLANGTSSEVKSVPDKLLE